MLTIHTPIELTVDPSMLTINDNFTKRLTGNYQMIGNGLEPEDMLHFLSEPPEVYLAEGGMTALIENNKIVENQNLKFDVINNVLNRILVSDTYRMTYQDQVFIQSVLNKMGITDVEEFIRQVQNSKEEIKNVSYLTDLYWNQQETVSQLLEYRKLRSEQKEEKEEEAKQKQSEEGLWLHQEIMNRLKTAAVYQEVKNYISASTQNNRMITAAEMQISEQNVVVQNILLNKLRNYTRIEEQPLVYHHLNTYELGDEITSREGDKQTINRLVQAVLLNALHQMYALRVEELMKQDHVWYRLADSIYQATENTIQRFVAYHDQTFITEKQADSYSKQVQQYQRNEIKAIEQLYEETQQTVIQKQEGRTSPEVELVYPDGETQQEGLAESVNRTAPEMISQTIEKTQAYGQQIQSITRQEALLKEQLEQINQNNIRNLTLLSQLNLQKPEERKPDRINRAKAREDALQALREPEEVLLTYLESETVKERQESIEKNRLKQVFGEETIRIFETLEKYQKSPGYLKSAGTSGQGEAMLLKDIRISERPVQTDLIHKSEELQREIIHELENTQIVREFLPEQVNQVRRTTQKQIDRIELVHKQEETTLEEEFLEEMRHIARTTKVENEQNTQTVIEKNTTQEVINTQIHDFQAQKNEELVRMVTDKVQNQLGSISEQIYGKLEKRMDMERRRRGL